MSDEHKIIIESVLINICIDIFIHLGIMYIKKKKKIIKLNLLNIIDDEILMILDDSEDI